LSLTEFLQTLEVKWDKGEAPTTARFNKLLDDTRESPHAAIINEVVLRTQMQAHYSSDNLGHFGLNLARYAHFTSPIRRYADLIVHRALIRALGLGDDGLTDQDISQIKDTAEVITHAERRAMAAERDATDRYIAAFLADRVGATFTGRITGVTRFGLFVKLDETGADGLVPVSTLGEEYLRPRRPHARPGRRAHRQALPAGPGRRGQAARGHAGDRRPAVRDADRGAAGGSEGAAAEAGHPGQAGDQAARRTAEGRAAREAAVTVSFSPSAPRGHLLPQGEKGLGNGGLLPTQIIQRQQHLGLHARLEHRLVDVEIRRVVGRGRRRRHVGPGGRPAGRTPPGSSGRTREVLGPGHQRRLVVDLAGRGLLQAALTQADRAGSL
jgi:hypothetical protein